MRCIHVTKHFQLQGLSVPWSLLCGHSSVDGVTLLIYLNLNKFHLQGSKTELEKPGLENITEEEIENPGNTFTTILLCYVNRAKSSYLKWMIYLSKKQDLTHNLKGFMPEAPGIVEYIHSLLLLLNIIELKREVIYLSSILLLEYLNVCWNRENI